MTKILTQSWVINRKMSLSHSEIDKSRRVTIKFQSPIWRNPIEPEEDTTNNNQFEILLFIPSDFDELPRKHILIMINGLGEYHDSVYIHHKMGLCAKFQGIGIATCFLPLPFHFNRLSEQDELILKKEKGRVAAIRKQSPGRALTFNHPTVHKIIHKKSRFYLGYEQLLKDLKALTEIINDSKKDGTLPADTKISLWGFSIGGLGVLGRFFEEPDSYHACILVHSGANFVTLGYNKDILTGKQWEEMRAFWLHIAEKLERADLSVLRELPELFAINRFDLEKFAMLFLGCHREKLLEFTKLYSHKILLFIGGRDDVNSLSSVISTLVPEEGLAMHTLPGLQHNIHVSRVWLDYEIAIVRDFLDKHPDSF